VDRENAILLALGIFLVVATVRTPLLEFLPVGVRYFLRATARVIAILFLLLAIVTVVGEAATWLGPGGELRFDTPWYSVVLWLALIFGPLLFLTGLTRWVGREPLVQRAIGWVLMLGAISVTSLSDIGQVLMVVLLPFLQRFTQDLTTNPWPTPGVEPPPSPLEKSPG
jgi:hypothetical protein